jgi:hypothetical protein
LQDNIVSGLENALVSAIRTSMDSNGSAGIRRRGRAVQVDPI